jgi:uncharacterized membrane protein (UPF0127 family)
MKVLNSRGFQAFAYTILALALCAAIAACADRPRVALTAPDGSTRAVVKVEVVNTPSTREFGLMYRKHLDEDAGMIFVFPAADHLSFWMKNTVIPLDMIFADARGKIVGVVQNAEPFSERPLSVEGDSLYVLEVNGGFTQRNHVQAGDAMKFLGFAPHALE